VWLLAALMVLAGLGGPLVMPAVTGVLLNSVPADRAGTASGVFNTSRQAGGALAVAVFGGLLAHQGTFTHGLRVSLLIAAAVALAAAGGAAALHTPRRAGAEDGRVSGGVVGRGATAAADLNAQEA
jgi:sugar phosphate permease